MSVATYTTDLVTITTADTVTGFSEPASSTAGGAPVSELDFFIQGTSSVSKSFNATGTGGTGFTAPANIAPVSGGVVYVWTYFAAPNALNTKINGGQQILIGSSRTTYNRYYVAGRDTYIYGGWVNYPVDPTVAATATVGAPTSALRFFGYAVNGVNPVSKGRPYGIDVIRYGRGTITITGGNGVNSPANFAGIATANDDINARWGIFSLDGGTYKMQGRLLFTRDAFLTPTRFKDSAKTIVIQNTEFVTPSFNAIEVVDIDDGSDEGSFIIEDITILSLSTASPGNFLVAGLSPNVSITSCAFSDLGRFTFQGGTTITETSFTRCDRIILTDARMTNCVIDSPRNSVAMQIDVPPNISNCTFISSGNVGTGMQITAPMTITLSNIRFIGYGDSETTSAAIVNKSGGVVTINIIDGGTIPTILNENGSTTIILVGGNVTLTGLKLGTVVKAYIGINPSTATLIASLEALTPDASVTFPRRASGQTGYIHAFSLGYQPVRIPIIYGATDTTILVRQVIDKQYDFGSI